LGKQGITFVTRFPAAGQFESTSPNNQTSGFSSYEPKELQSLSLLTCSVDRSANEAFRIISELPDNLTGIDKSRLVRVGRHPAKCVPLCPEKGNFRIAGDTP
jgi:hypothetical protein